MKNYLLSLKEKIHILQNIYIKNKFYKKKKTYSMHGEDLIIGEYFKNINNGFYIDIGCYHPLQYNNTTLLYQRGWNGINVDVSDFSINCSTSLTSSITHLFNLVFSTSENESSCISISKKNRHRNTQTYH